MPGAGGTGQQKQAQGIDLYDLLAGEIAKSLQAEQPQAPQPPQQQPLSPVSAFAAARNPQFAPMLNQQAQAPEQARYASQQAAFEAAMSGRERAMQTGASLVGSQMRSGGRPQIRENTIVGDDGKRYRVQETVDPSSGAVLSQRVVGQAPENMAFLPTPQGFYPASRQTGQAGGGPVQSGGATLYPAPPAGIAQGAITQRGLRVIAEEARDASLSYAQKRGGLARTAIQTAGNLPFVGGLARTATGYVEPEAELTNTSIGRVSDMLLRLKSGAQINESEYQRLTKLVPQIGESPEVIAGKWAQFFTELGAIEKARGDLFPATATQQPAQQSDPLLEELWGGQ